MHACLLHIYDHALLHLLFIRYLLLRIGHGFVQAQFYPNKDRFLSCLRHPFGYVLFCTLKLPNGF
jgi:hypothetical protein